MEVEQKKKEARSGKRKIWARNDLKRKTNVTRFASAFRGGSEREAFKLVCDCWSEKGDSKYVFGLNFELHHKYIEMRIEAEGMDIP